jgi:acyl carrier protein
MPADQNSTLAEIGDMLRAIRDDLDTGVDIGMDTMFRTDLGVDSIDIVALAGRLQARYGDRVNFAEFIAGQGLESVRDLRVGQLVGYILDSVDEEALPA